MNKKIKVQIVGRYYAPYLKFTDNIYVQNVCTGVSPLSLCCERDERLIREWESKIKDLKQWSEKPSPSVYSRQTQDLFDIKKNFRNFLSKNTEDFCDNTVFSFAGKEVIYKNEADYIIVDNTSALRSVIKYNGTFYTQKWPKTPFSNFVSTQSDANMILPWDTDSSYNWRYYYDSYIDAILSEYQSEQIILIKSPYSKFYYENEELHQFENLNSKQGAFINRLDDYFTERTGCYVIDDLCSRIPMQYLNPHGYPYGNALGRWEDDVVDHLNKILDGKRKSFASGSIYSSLIAKNINRKVRDDKKTDLSDLTVKAEYQRAVSSKNLFTGELTELGQFVEKEYHSISDYLDSCSVENIEPDIKLVEMYTKYFKCDLNDILSIFALYSLCEDEKRDAFKNIICNIFNSDSSAPIKKCVDLYNENISFLNNYKYIDKSVLNNSKIKKKYIRICDNAWVVIESGAKYSMNIVNNIIETEKFDYDEIIKNGCICSVKFADELTYCYDYYIEKAKKGFGSMPTYLSFTECDDLYDSLCYINYSDLLKNDNFVFAISEDKPDCPKNYVPTVDFTEMIDSDLVIIKLFNGLGDQFCYLMLGTVINKYTGRKVLYDDTWCMDFNGLEVDKFSKYEMNLLSKKLSYRLKSFEIGKTYKNLFLKISPHFTYFVVDYNRYISFAEGNSCFIGGKDLEKFISTIIPYTYYDSLLRIENLRNYYDFEFSDYVQFPPFVKQSHIDLSNKMMSSDSVVIHVRRGDYVSTGRDVGEEYYIEAIEKVMSISDYKNKIFFVFSDDINWCKENPDKLGLNQVGECEIVYVDSNKGEESYRDIQLMSYGKVMIIGPSYFPVISALYNKNLEVFMCSNEMRQKLFSNFHTNKYDLSNFSKNYSYGQTERIPKNTK